MGNTNATKSRMFIIATGLFIVTMSTVLFLIKENKLDINHNEVKTFVLQEEEQTEKSYRELIENNEDDLLVLNSDTSVTLSSPELVESLGYNADDFKEKNFFSIVHPDDLNEVSNVFIEGKDDNFGPIRLLTSAGEYIPYLVSMKIIESETGELLSTALTLKNTSQPVGESLSYDYAPIQIIQEDIPEVEEAEEEIAKEENEQIIDEVEEEKEEETDENINEEILDEEVIEEPEIIENEEVKNDDANDDQNNENNEDQDKEDENPEPVIKEDKKDDKPVNDPPGKENKEIRPTKNNKSSKK